MPAPAQWLWQQPGWPKLVFDQGVLGPALSRARHAQGRVLGKAQALGLANLGGALADIWVEEAAATARIEGEKLDLAAVRSSVARRLGMTAVGSVQHRLLAPAGAGRGTRYYVAMDGWGADARAHRLVTR